MIEAAIGLLVVALVTGVLALFVWRLVVTLQIQRSQQRLEEELGGLRQMVQQLLQRLPPVEAPPAAPPATPVSALTPVRPVPMPPGPPMGPRPEAPRPVVAPPAPARPLPPPLPTAGAPLPAMVAPVAPTAQVAVAVATEPAGPEVETQAVAWLRRMRNWILYGTEELPVGVSVEYAVATNWLLRLGIVITVIGFGFFLKYTFDRNLISPTARVVLCMVTGAGMVAGGVRLLHRQYHLFGQGLVGGGIATLYLSVFASAMLPRYQLLSPQAALPLMAVVTVAAGVLAVRHESLLVAVLGALGGYATPVLLQTGQANFVGLFTYMLLLGGGILGVAHRRNWPLLNYLGFLCNYALVYVALEKHYQVTDFWAVMPFLAAFFCLYSTLPLLYNVARRQPSTLLELGAMVANAAVFFALSHHLVSQAHGARWVAVVSLALAAFYVVHVWVFLHDRLTDRPLLLTLLALAGFFVTVSMPLALSREWLTVSWSLQGLLMLWVAARLNSEFLRLCAYLVYVLALGRLGLVDLGREFGPGATLTPAEYGGVLLDRLVSFGVPVLSLAGAYRLLRVPVPAGATAVAREADIAPAVPGRGATIGFLALAVVLAFLYLHLEMNRLFLCLYAPARLPALTGLWVALCIFLAMVCGRVGGAAVRTLLTLAVLAVLAKLFVVDLGFWQLDLRPMRYLAPYAWEPVLMRTLDFGLIAGFLLVFPRLAGGMVDLGSWRRLFGSLAIAVLFVYCTLEVSTGLLIFRPGFRAGGVSIVWSLFALGLIVGGIRSGRRALRLTGLGLFAVVVLKVFLADLDRLEPLYRIVSFILLGMLVLCGSLLYLRGRGSFVVNPEPPPAKE